jgi:lon-related putative ATP-dependent protease
MTTARALAPEELCYGCDPSGFEFETTADLEDLDEILGQERAVEAIRFGIGMQRQGYNLYALGPSGTGKRTTIRQFLDRRAALEPIPSDWCYVNNFETPHKPRVLQLPPGHGIVLRDDMQQLIEELRTAIPAAFESEDYRTRKQEAEEEFKEQQEKAFGELQKQAMERSIGLMRTPAGLAFVPLRENEEGEKEVVSPDEFQKLPEEARKQYEADISALQGQLQKTVAQVRDWERDARDRVKDLNREVAMFAVGDRIEELITKYAELPRVVEYLNEVREDVIDNVEEFRGSEKMPQQVMGIPLPRMFAESPVFRRYQVNVLVDHSQSQGAPVVYEDHPTYMNLVGRIEHLAQMGALFTDFSLIKPGALHQANGGYLIVDAREMLLQPYAWDGLKRALRSQEVRIESLGQALSLVSTVSLEPEPIPLNVKIVLIGERRLYYLLYQLDPDFPELFKIEADFNEAIGRDGSTNQLYARLIATMIRRDELRPFDRGAVARVIERSARMADDAQKLSVHLLGVGDLLREADYWAAESGNGTVSDADVQRAIEAQVHRAGRIRERMQERIQRGIALIDVAGAKVGQINALSVISLGNLSFAVPHRVTARARLGKGEFVDIEREVELGGPIHSKGVMILSSFLGARYAADRPLSLSASLVFEQSYGHVEGDSASMAELCALLSTLAEVPIKQSWAMTGSVNQYGQAQPIGAVNEKIEGFFDVCASSGLTGEQGVIIPAANIQHLMLRQDVVQAVKDGEFRIHAIENVDEAIEFLTEVPAGAPDEYGRYPLGSINQLVEARLAELAEVQRSYATPPPAEDPGSSQREGQTSEETEDAA